MSDIATQLTIIAENQQKVYDAGYSKGQAEGGDTDAAYQQGVIDGKQAEYDAFWDIVQENGNRTDYQNAFSGKSWTHETFKPKYDIMAKQAYMVFRYTGITNLVEALNGKNCTIQTGVLQYTFNNTNFEVIDGVEFETPITRLDGTFNDSKKLREIIPTLPISENASTLDAFRNCNALETVRFSGVIPVNLNLPNSPNLTSDSVQSIIDHLKDLTGQTAKTLTFHATVVGRLTNEQKASINAKNWTLVV